MPNKAKYIIPTCLAGYIAIAANSLCSHMSNSKSYIEVSEIVGMAGYTALTALMVGTGIRHEGITRNPNERGRIRNLERTFHD